MVPSGPEFFPVSAGGSSVFFFEDPAKIIVVVESRPFGYEGDIVVGSLKIMPREGEPLLLYVLRDAGVEILIYELVQFSAAEIQLIAYRVGRYIFRDVLFDVSVQTVDELTLFLRDQIVQENVIRACLKNFRGSEYLRSRLVFNARERLFQLGFVESIGLAQVEYGFDKMLLFLARCDLPEHYISNDDSVILQRRGCFYKPRVALIDYQLAGFLTLLERVRVAFEAKRPGCVMAMHKGTESAVTFRVRQNLGVCGVKKNYFDTGQYVEIAHQFFQFFRIHL